MMGPDGHGMAICMPPFFVDDVDAIDLALWPRHRASPAIYPDATKCRSRTLSAPINIHARWERVWHLRCVRLLQRATACSVRRGSQGVCGIDWSAPCHRLARVAVLDDGSASAQCIRARA